MKNRCAWAEKTELEKQYHDFEWGIPKYDDDTLFELLILEGMQAGLSWSTILNKRENFTKAFNNWNYHEIAQYDEEKIAELLLNPGIIRNKLKIKAAITNAQAFLQTQKEFGSFSDYIWNFVNHTPIVNSWEKQEDIPAFTALSDRISKDLKARGFKFVGSTIIYAYMQSVGMVNDHIRSCFCRD